VQGGDLMRRHLRRRFHPPGTAPGTLEAAQIAAAPTTLLLVTYDAESASFQPVATVEEAASRIVPGRVSWLRVVGHDPSVIERLGSSFGIHPLALEDMLHVGQRPKAEEYPDTLFIVLQVLRGGDGDDIDEEQVAVVLLKDLVITVEERDNSLFAPIDARLREGGSRIRLRGADYLAYAVIDTIVDYLFPLLDHFSMRLEEVEDELLEEPSRERLQHLQTLKRSLLRLRRAVWPTREMTGALMRTQSSLIAAENHVFLRDVYDHTVQVLDIVETFRDLSTSLMELYLSAVSNRMNEVMKVLTIIATVFIPLTFIAGLYGMNFSPEVSPFNMPELHWRFGYLYALSLMALAAVLMAIFFKRRGWW
jgi:magnesium transporter